MTRKRSNFILAVVLVLSVFGSGICYDIIGNEIKSKELNLSISEQANRDKISVDGFLYDMGKKGYGSYQSNRYDYEEHQRIYEKRRDEISNLKTIRIISSIFIMIMGICSALIIYKKKSHSE